MTNSTAQTMAARPKCSPSGKPAAAAESPDARPQDAAAAPRCVVTRHPRPPGALFHSMTVDVHRDVP